MSTPSFAYLSNGKLTLVLPGQQPRLVESQFVAGIEERRSEHRRKHGWRAGGMWNFNAMGPMPGLADGEEPGPGDQTVARFLGVTEGAGPGEIYYTLQTDMVGGLFLLDVKQNYERRLAHRQNMQLADLARHPSDGRLVCTARQPDGSAHIGIMEAEGGRLRELTEGDSVDESPSWVPSAAATILFQSAGIGRDEMGGVFGLAPYEIIQFDMVAQEFSTILELPDFDCLSPKMSADGSLFYIRRPYELRKTVSPLQHVKDIALFPFRLARAFVHFLNAFSMFFSRKPLLTAGGPKREGPDKRWLMLYGRWVEVDRDIRSGKQPDKPLVPKTWELIRRSVAGDEETIAAGVISFDLTDDGGILYTDGVSVFSKKSTASDAPAERVARGHLIERVISVAV